MGWVVVLERGEGGGGGRRLPGDGIIAGQGRESSRQTLKHFCPHCSFPISTASCLRRNRRLRVPRSMPVLQHWKNVYTLDDQVSALLILIGCLDTVSDRNHFWHIRQREEMGKAQIIL